ncbi:MAG: 4-hydroxy-3-methylbut-2-enyl diphosphate reductase [Flammeovirgaceae bacterium]|nr:4-hydroxy-3-methylbut-2-enyl diphosphate reductase [Flammeovirgaceae bacterium]
MEVRIDEKSGYCFGVEFAIQMAEEEMDENGELYCLGDIVHNAMEVARLHKKGLKIIEREDLKNLKNCKVLIRAHGEPPETYQQAMENNIELIDASCPVVLKLQNRVKNSYDQMQREDGQMVIYGKVGHAEVIGLNGQTKDSSIIVTTVEDLDKVDFSRPVTLFSQTTKSTKGFYEIKAEIERRVAEASTQELNNHFKANDSICRQVSNREPQMEKFSQENDVIIFVSGKKSSNGKSLHSVCKKFNSRSYFVENESEISPEWFNPGDKVGISGATSTPMWLMENVKNFIEGIEKTALNS